MLAQQVAAGKRAKAELSEVFLKKCFPGEEHQWGHDRALGVKNVPRARRPGGVNTVLFPPEPPILNGKLQFESSSSMN